MAMIRMPSEAPPAGPGPALAAPVPGASRGPGLRALHRIVTAIRSNRKATWGFVLLVFFCLVSAFPWVIAHDQPNAMAYKTALGPSTRHLLGTTGLGQDMFSQIVWGARPVLLIAFGAGLAATGIAVMIGVAAAYLGGFWDAVLNVLTDVLLVIPLFPLLIIIAGYLHTDFLCVQTYHSAQKSVLVVTLSKLSSWPVCVIPVCSASPNSPATQAESDQCLHWACYSYQLQAHKTRKVRYHKIRLIPVLLHWDVTYSNTPNLCFLYERE